MSIKVLLKCSDTEFERLISLMDIESVLDIISELQTEMDKEQEKFENLSTLLSRITDQASAEFRRLSTELVKSQNMLALLIARNMHCFKLSNEPDEDADTNNGSPLITYKSNSSVSGEWRGNNPQNKSSEGIQLNQQVKALKPITSMSKSWTNGSKPAMKSNSISAPVPKETSSRHDASDEEKSKDSIEHCKMESRATLTVISPRNGQDVKPRRVLKVRSTSLSSDNSTMSSPRSPSDYFEATKTFPSSANTTNIHTTPRSGGIFSPQRVSTSTDNSVKSTMTVSPPAVRGVANPFRLHTSKSRTSPLPLGVDGDRSALSSSTPRSESTRTSISDIVLSPRSDISNLATPRSMVGSPRLPISSILELDIPETSIDGGTHWEKEACTPVGSSEADKVSCTTDESGFTSASSDSDVTLTAPDIVYDYHSEEDEKVEERVFMKSWNPSKLLAEIYTIELAKEPSGNENTVINMEGYLERLPVGKNKNTLLKTWKRTYCKAVDGFMYFYDRKNSDQAQSYMSLMGGVLEELSNKMIGIDDMRGHYLMVRCPSEADHMNWRRSFHTQIKCSPHTSYIRPCLQSNASPHIPKVVIIDLGSTSIRAGRLGSTPSYPQLFFPSVSSTNKNGQVVFGAEAYLPENRVNGLHRPIATCKEIDTYRINVQVLPDLFKKIFAELEVDVQEYMVLLSTPHNFSLRLKEEIINILINQHKVEGVNMVNQSLLIPYIYNATSGIVVDIGERIEVVAITDGYLIDGGLNRQSFGGGQITETLNTYLVEYRLFTPVEQLLTRLVKEKTCFVSQDYGEDLLKYMCEESACEATVNLSSFDLPADYHVRHISIETARFKAAEGLIKTGLLGVDSPTLPKLIDQAVQKCPMDVRREMWQSIYLSGGTTLTQGFAERLQKELGKIAPSSITIQVHSSPHRYHAAYIGACMLAKLPTFLESCVTREEWSTIGPASLNKWKKYFQG